MKISEETWLALLAGELAEDELRVVLEQLKGDEEGRRRLREHRVLEGMLSVALEGEVVAAKRQAEVLCAIERVDQDDFVAGVTERIRPRRRWRWIAGVAAMWVLGWGWWSWSGSEVSGTIARVETVRWRGGEGRTLGDRLEAGAKISLESGLVEIEMAGRGRMIVEGPAELELKGPMRAVLEQGRVTMRVTERGHGYRLETPEGSVVDLGTEFGVSVTGSGVETHVMEGEVEALTRNGGKVLLKRHDALRVHAGSGERIEMDAGSFYTVLPPSRSGRSGFIHWPLEVARAGVDEAVVSGLNVADGEMRLLGAEGAGVPQRVPGVFGSALAFDGKGAYAESLYPGVGGREPRTVGFWVKVPEDLQPQESYAMVSWGAFKAPGSVWQISVNPNAAQGLVGGIRVGTHEGRIVGATDLRDGRWHHVAVVLYEASQPDIGKHVLIYLDGNLERLSSRALLEVNTNLEDSTHGVWLGRNVVPQRPSRVAREADDGAFFRGELDEVYVFDSALSQSEVLRLMRENRGP